MTRRPLENHHPNAFRVPQNFAVDEVLIAEVIRETDSYHKKQPLTPVLAFYESGQYVITGNIAAYLVAMHLKLDSVPTMREN